MRVRRKAKADSATKAGSSQTIEAARRSHIQNAKQPAISAKAAAR